jgi:hypothetical protein
MLYRISGVLSEAEQAGWFISLANIVFSLNILAKLENLEEFFEIRH